MLGSHFDLDKEIARIATRREAKGGKIHPRERQSEHMRAYSAFARSLTDFVRAVGDDGGTSRTDAKAATDDAPAGDPNVAKPEQDRSATLLDLAAVRKVAGRLGQIR